MFGNPKRHNLTGYATKWQLRLFYNLGAPYHYIIQRSALNVNLTEYQVFPIIIIREFAIFQDFYY